MSNEANEDIIYKHKVIEFLPFMPNIAIKDFYISQINNIIKSSQPDLIDIYNHINTSEDNKNIALAMSEILDDIIVVENIKWQDISNVMLCDKINAFLSGLITLNNEEGNPVNLSLEIIEKINLIINQVKTWIEVEHKFPITNDDHLYTLYKYISPENTQVKILDQLFELYEEMF